MFPPFQPEEPDPSQRRREKVFSSFFESREEEEPLVRQRLTALDFSVQVFFFFFSKATALLFGLHLCVGVCGFGGKRTACVL